jgi:hypothetical protein
MVTYELLGDHVSQVANYDASLDWNVSMFKAAEMVHFDINVYLIPLNRGSNLVHYWQSRMELI